MTQFADKTKPVRAGEELDAGRLEAYLRENLPDAAKLDAGGPLAIEQFPAGHSNLTYAVRLGSREMVLRRPPFGSKVKSAHDMGREYRVLSKLHAHFPPAPAPLLYCDDVEVLGAPFYLMNRIRGTIIRRDPPTGMDFSPEIARRLSESFVDTLAQLHTLDFEAIGLGDLGKPVGYMQRQVEGWIKRYEGSKTHEIPEVEPAARWLVANTPDHGGAALIHNDYKYDNVIVDSADVTKIIGVLDWEMCTLGDPLSDLGTALCYWIDADDPGEMHLIRWAPTTAPGSLTRRQLVERYEEKTGRDTSDMVFYYAYAMFKTAVIAQQIYYRFHHGMTKDERFAAFLEATKIMMRASLRAAETGKY